MLFNEVDYEEKYFDLGAENLDVTDEVKTAQASKSSYSREEKSSSSSSSTETTNESNKPYYNELEALGKYLDGDFSVLARILEGREQ